MAVKGVNLFTPMTDKEIISPYKTKFFWTNIVKNVCWTIDKPATEILGLKG